MLAIPPVHRASTQFLLVIALSVVVGGILHFHMVSSSDALQPLEAFYSLPMVAVIFLSGGVHGAPASAWVVAPYLGAFVQNLILWAIVRTIINVARKPST